MASILILGAYGFIGSEVTRACLSEGHSVHAFGRDAAQLARLDADRVWCRDLRDMVSASDWTEVLSGVDVVVNASGALQDGPRDDVARVQRAAIVAMAEAALGTGVQRLIQISAAGAVSDASTEFMTSKADADAALLESPVDCVVLRPGLVLGNSVYGGTNLLRMLAAVPLIQPIAHPTAPVQVVGMADLVSAVLRCVRGDVPAGRAYDLVASEVVTLGELVTVMRDWLGFPAARLTVRVGPVISGLTGKVADMLGRLGWRSPLRSTSMAVLEHGVTGDPGPWKAATGSRMQGLQAILGASASTVQDRVHARMALMGPVLIAGMSVFWLLSGAIGVLSFGSATEVLSTRGFGTGSASLFVALGCVADLALGAGVLVKRWARPAMLGMIAVSLGYLIAGTLWTPDLWGDPLGPFVKVLPAIVLAAVGYMTQVER